MVSITRSRSTLLSSLKASKAGIAKPSKASSSATKAVLKIDPAQLVQVAIKKTRPVSPTAANPPLLPFSAILPDSLTSTSVTTGTLKEGIAHLLRVEPKLAPFVDEYECTLFSEEGLAEPVDHFHSLASGIISQQVSSAAAKSIKAKFVGLFSEELSKDGISFPTPDMVLKYDHPTLRTAGLSTRKAEYICSLSEHFISGDLSAEVFATASDDEIVRKLVQVRGIGAWSAEMFLLFGLKRMDVFSVGDLGIQRGQAVIAGRDVKKLKSTGKGKWKYLSETDMIKYSEPFKPYRSLYMWYLWKASDVSVESFKSEKKKTTKALKGKGKVAEE